MKVTSYSIPSYQGTYPRLLLEQQFEDINAGSRSRSNVRVEFDILELHGPNKKTTSHTDCLS